MKKEIGSVVEGFNGSFRLAFDIMKAPFSVACKFARHEFDSTKVCSADAAPYDYRPHSHEHPHTEVHGQ